MRINDLLRPLQDLSYLFFPHLCLACERNAPAYTELICTPCRATLPEARFHLQKENAFTERFWGRVPLQAGAAMYLFTKESRVQQLIHNLKYNGKKEVGMLLGRSFGRSLRQAPLFQAAELIVPVPLHLRKELQRGYNQSVMFGQGLSEGMNIPLLENGLKRTIHSKSLTRQSREARLQSTSEVFTVNRPKALQGKHILLVDDVLTTGATLEACALHLLEIPGVKISMATIAIAVH